MSTDPPVSKRAAALSPYTPGEQPQDRSYIKLNTNENPYPPAPAVEEVLRTFDPTRLRLYPDPESTSLRKALSRTYGLGPESFFIGNGSDEVLSFIFYAFFDETRGSLLFPGHTYSFFPVYCSYYGIPYRKVALDGNFFIDPADYIRITREQPCAGIIFPNPNAPTGAALLRDEVEEILENVPDDLPVVVDEAYADFGAESSIPLIAHYPNLIISQTFSKNRSLAGSRLGFAVAGEKVISTLMTVKNSFNSYPVDTLSQLVGIRSLEDEDHFEKNRERIIATREKTIRRLEDHGWIVIPSKANFIFTRHPDLRGEETYTRLKEEGILVRYFGHEGIEDYIRISIGTDEEMDQLIEALTRIKHRETGR